MTVVYSFGWIVSKMTFLGGKNKTSFSLKTNKSCNFEVVHGGEEQP